MYDVGLKYKTDKVTHHKYHEIYDLFLRDSYLKHGSMLEIGINSGKSLKMWLELFPNAYIYGMDINQCYEGERHIVFTGDQSKIEDLNIIKENIASENLFFINDDGSHLPEHQILTFNELFPLLCENGIYIIEDIETSYWTKNDVYSYPTRYGYKHPNSIIEIFKDVADIVNSEFCGYHENKVNHHDKIGSITFSKNCIIILKKTQEKRDYRFSYNL